ncbi:hypothetical protein [Haladaptatus sp. DJG-WS-42]|uniref:hypothetical protein n=1 Tax=Haladaptatus sp. DJG-WS-42 TaxID=3120516 RepID=UPI0030D3DCAA
MERSVRYALSVLVAIGVTGFVYLVAPPPEASLDILAGLGVVYAAGAFVWLRYWTHLTTVEAPSPVSGLFTGVTTFAGISLLNGLPDGTRLGVTALGFGLAWFGFAAGVGVGVE